MERLDCWSAHLLTLQVHPLSNWKAVAAFHPFFLGPFFNEYFGFLCVEGIVGFLSHEERHGPWPRALLPLRGKVREEANGHTNYHKKEKVTSFRGFFFFFLFPLSFTNLGWFLFLIFSLFRKFRWAIFLFLVSGRRSIMLYIFLSIDFLGGWLFLLVAETHTHPPTFSRWWYDIWQDLNEKDLIC